MSEEETKEVKEQPTEKAPEEIQLDDIMADAPVVSQQETSKPNVDEKSTEVTTEETEPKESEPEETVKPEEKGEDVEPEEPKVEPKYSDEDIEAWRKDSENKSNWQKSLTKKSQFVNKYDDDKIANLEAMAQLQDKMKDFKPDPLPEFILTKDEFGEEVKLNSNLVKPQIEKIIEQSKSKWIEEVAPKLREVESLREQSEQATKNASNQAALVRMEQYFSDFPDNSFDLGDDPIQTINDIDSSGKVHPDYKKLLNLNAVAQRSAVMGISMKEAHIDLFGKTEQIKKAEETIKKEQESVQTEKPGQSVKVVTEDDEFNKSMDIGTIKKDNVFD